MSCIYGITKKKFKDKEGIEKEAYYAIARTSAKISTDEIAMDVSRTCSLAPGDVLSAIKTLNQLIAYYLKTGRSVKLDGIGVIGLAITSDPAQEPNMLNKRSIKVSKICFRADRKLAKEVKNVTFVKEKPIPKDVC